jgi:hypothetical protein
MPIILIYKIFIHLKSKTLQRENLYKSVWREKFSTIYSTLHNGSFARFRTESKFLVVQIH